MKFLLSITLFLTSFAALAKPPTVEEIFIAKLGAEDQMAIMVSNFSGKPITQEQLDAYKQPRIQAFRAKVAKMVESGTVVPVPSCSLLFKGKNHESYSCMVEGMRLPEIYSKRDAKWYYGSGATPLEEAAMAAEAATLFLGK